MFAIIPVLGTVQEWLNIIRSYFVFDLQMTECTQKMLVGSTRFCNFCGQEIRPFGKFTDMGNLTNTGHYSTLNFFTSSRVRHWMQLDLLNIVSLQVCHACQLSSIQCLQYIKSTVYVNWCQLAVSSQDIAYVLFRHGHCLTPGSWPPVWLTQPPQVPLKQLLSSRAKVAMPQSSKSGF